MEGYGRFFTTGIVKVEAKGQNIERFIHISANRGLRLEQIRSLEGQDSGVGFWTTPEHFKQMKDVAKKTKIRIRLQQKEGISFWLLRNKKRKGFVAGCLLFGFLLFYVSFFIWDISIEGNLRYSDEILLHYLESMSVVWGTKKSNVSCESLEEQIRMEFSDITWVSAEIKGTRLLIQIKENEGFQEHTDNDDGPCDLRASKNAEIVDIVMRSGILCVELGAFVCEGDLLVDGTVPIYDDSGSVVECREVCSDAEIYAITEEHVYFTLPLTEQRHSRTGKQRRGGMIQVPGRSFYLLPLSDSGHLWEFYVEETQLKLLRNFYLPIFIGTIQAYEYVPYEIVYTEEDAAGIFECYLQEYMEKLSEKGIQILEDDGKIELSESGWIYEGTISVIENIAERCPNDMESEPE